MIIRRKLVYKIDLLDITNTDLNLEKINSDIKNLKEICKEQKEHIKIYDVSEDYLVKASNVKYFLKDFVKGDIERTKQVIKIPKEVTSLMFIHSYLTELESITVFNSMYDIVPRYRLVSSRSTITHNFQRFLDLEFTDLNNLKFNFPENKLYHCIFILKISGQVEIENSNLKILSVNKGYRYSNVLNPYIPYSNFKIYSLKSEKLVSNDYSFIDILFSYIPTNLSYYNKYINGILDINKEHLKKYFNLEQTVEIKERTTLNEYFPFSLEENSVSYFNKIFLEDILTFKSLFFNYYFNTNRIEGLYLYIISTLFKDTQLLKQIKESLNLSIKNTNYPIIKDMRLKMISLNTKYKEELFSEESIKGLQVLTLFMFFTNIVGKSIIESKGYFHIFSYNGISLPLIPWFDKTGIVNLFTVFRNLDEENAILNITKGYSKAIDFIYDNFKFAKRIYELKNPESTNNDEKNSFIYKSIKTAIKTKNSIEKSRKKTTEEKICLLYLVDTKLLDYIMYSFEETTESILSKIVIIKTNLRRNISQ